MYYIEISRGKGGHKEIAEKLEMQRMRSENKSKWGENKEAEKEKAGAFAQRQQFQRLMPGSEDVFLWQWRQGVARHAGY